jgi:Raf kinase inhibitor-like YbhB/YbcL family protein
MRITHRLAKPLPAKIPLLVGIGILVLGLLALSFLLSLSRTSHIALASSNALHPFTITSPNFRDGGPLSQTAEFNQFGCTGSNIAPQLNWTNVPAGTRSFVMLMSDYDAPVAGGFHHWIVYNIPAHVRELEGNNAFTEGTNSFGFTGYGGPCPPPTGEIHHYLFLLYATNIAQVGGPGLTFSEVVSAIQGNVLGATSIIGTFHLPQ